MEEEEAYLAWSRMQLTWRYAYLSTTGIYKPKVLCYMLPSAQARSKNDFQKGLGPT